MTPEKWDMKGMLTSINIKGRDGPESHECVFTIRPKDGDDQGFKLEPFKDQSRYQAMLTVLTASLARDDVEVSVRQYPKSSDYPKIPKRLPYVYEVEVRAVKRKL